MLMGFKTKLSHVTRSADELPRVGSRQRLEHSLELLPGPKAPLAMSSVGRLDLRKFILATVQKALPENQQGKAFEIARAVIVEANHHKMDPLFLLAVIATESQFNINARGTHGEIGLMQVMPGTAKWLAPKVGLGNKFDLEEPVVNIRIGASYLAKLRQTFHHRSKRYVAAYNMGSRNVRRLIATHVEPRIYPTLVLNNYEQIYLSLSTPTTPFVARGIAQVQ